MLKNILEFINHFETNFCFLMAFFVENYLIKYLCLLFMKAVVMPNSELIRSGRNLRGLLNDLKRDVPTAAKELDISEQELNSYIAGEMIIPLLLINKAVEIWPLNIRDFFILEDDTSNGMLFFSKEKSESSSRILKRGGQDYYEYRDTAMSKGSTFRPEWIKELVIVENNDPYSKKIFWNKGHFLHQFTYFVGPVNFYYEVNGKKYCVPMNTGDSMYITPYVPHTFTTRKNEKGEFGFILAVTFGGKIFGDAQQELSLLGHDLSKDFLIDYSKNPTGNIIKKFREQMNISQEYLVENSLVSLKRLIDIESGKVVASKEEMDKIALTLKIPSRELIPLQLEDPVIIVLYNNARKWQNNSYTFVELSSPIKLPYLKAFEVNINTNQKSYFIKVISHQYLYNVSAENILLYFIDTSNTFKEVLLRPNDSVYLKPNIQHGFISEGGKLLVVRIGGRLTGDTMHELSLLDQRGFERLCGELTMWYDPSGAT